MEDEKSDSLFLYDVLDKIGVSEKFRRKHQENGIKRELLTTVTVAFFGKFVAYNFSSNCEGTTSPGLKSDMDMLTCYEKCPVIENLEEGPKKGFAALTVLDNETPYGYVKLQVVKDGCLISKHNYKTHVPKEVKGVKLHRSGGCFWRGTNDISTDDEEFTNTTHRGPAMTTEDSRRMSTDMTISMRCRRWPTFANEWLSRKRIYSWPENHVVNHFKSLGFFVVPIGHPKSEDKDLEWRVSFSLQERHLMFDLNDVQYKCYVMLKLINHDLIKGTIGESITSYHCKTCLFYAIEQNPKSTWVPENFFKCVIKCLNILLKWTKQSFCPNYFIPNENMFDRKMANETRLKVIDVLSMLLTEGASFLKTIRTDKLGDYFVYRHNSYVITTIEDESYLACSNMFYDIQRRIIHEVVFARAKLLNILNNTRKDFECKDTSITINDISRAISVHDKFLNWVTNIERITEHSIIDSWNVINLILPYFHTSLACHEFLHALTSGNTSLRKKQGIVSVEKFNRGTVSDLTSGRLKYITYLYACGMYRECEQELDALENKFKPYVMPVSQCRYQQEYNNPNLQTELGKQDFCTGDILKKYTSACVIFLPTEIEIIPDGLKCEIFRSVGTSAGSRNEWTDFWYDWVVVDSKAYMYFLQYLLSRKRNDSPVKRIMLLDKLAGTMNDAILHKETVCNLLAWALIGENCIKWAIDCMIWSWKTLETYFVKSRGVQKRRQVQHNAAKWHMLLILWKIWFSNDSFQLGVVTITFCFKCFEQTSGHFKVCSGCKIAKYCSGNCQKTDWISHRKICKLFTKK